MWDLQALKVRFFEKLLRGSLFTFKSFCQKSAERKSLKGLTFDEPTTISRLWRLENSLLFVWYTPTCFPMAYFNALRVSRISYDDSLESSQNLYAML